MIGATTLDEYRKHDRKGRRVGARFQTVLVDELTSKTPFRSCAGCANASRCSGVKIQDAALVAAATLSAPLHHRPLPAR